MSDEEITIQHLLNSLGQIERWLQAIRAALETLPRNQPLPLKSELRGLWTEREYSPLPLARSCLAPELPPEYRR